MGISLPASVLPAANYVPYVVFGNLVSISGQLPMKDGKPQDIGQVGAAEQSRECHSIFIGDLEKDRTGRILSAL